MNAVNIEISSLFMRSIGKREFVLNGGVYIKKQRKVLKVSMVLSLFSCFLK